MNTNVTVSKHQDIVPSGADDNWRSKQFYSEKETSRKETKTLTYPQRCLLAVPILYFLSKGEVVNAF